MCKIKKLKFIIILFIITIAISFPFIAYPHFHQDFKITKFNDTVEMAYGTEFKSEAGEACFGNAYNRHKVDVGLKSDVDTEKIGEYTVTYIYKYKDKILEKKQTVFVKDYEAPVITLNTDDFKVCPNITSSTFPASAYDDYDKDLTDKLTQTIEDNKVVFRVTDNSGNKAELAKELTFIDNEEPTIALNGKANVSVKLNDTYKEEGATASDNCDADINDKIVISGSVNTKKAGNYTITYTVEDSSHNKKSITRKVQVYKPVEPTPTPSTNTTTPSTTPSNNQSGSKTIYLTFDDGPSRYTAKLLDILKAYNVHATFFVTNQAITNGYDNLILRAYNEGHTIGLHSNTHNYNIYQNSDTYFADLYAIQEKVRRITGYTSTIIRFPGGSSNTISHNYDGGAHIMSTLTKEVEAKGFKYFDWNISSGDAGETTNSTQVFKNIIKGIGKGSSYVVLQHDIKSYSVNAVEDVIKYCLSKGYTFKALTMDSPTVHHHVNN